MSKDLVALLDDQLSSLKEKVSRQRKELRKLNQKVRELQTMCDLERSLKNAAYEKCRTEELLRANLTSEIHSLKSKLRESSYPKSLDDYLKDAGYLNTYQIRLTGQNVSKTHPAAGLEFGEDNIG